MRVSHFEKPLFCIGTQLLRDGGSGQYLGLEYSFDIKGNFLPEEGELPGMTNYYPQIFGIPVRLDVRKNRSHFLKSPFAKPAKGDLSQIIQIDRPEGLISSEYRVMIRIISSAHCS